MKKVEADVAVIAAGPSGLSAAIAAAQNGASVIVFERLTHTGGSAILGANHVFGVESRLQLKKQFTLSAEEAFKIWMNFTQWGTDARIVQTFISKSGDTIGWLEKMGVEFSDLTSHGRGNEFVAHIVGGKPPPPGMGWITNLCEIMDATAKELGIKIFFKTSAKKILKEGGKITGVVAESKDGETIQAKAKAVVIATGAFGGILGPVTSFLKGDGLRMAREAGAYVADGTMERWTKGGPSGASYASPFAMFSPPHMMVNLLGERFVDEEIAVNTPFLVNALTRQKDHCAFSIIDESTKRYYIENGLKYPMGFGIAQFGGITWQVKKFDTEMKLTVKQGSKDFFIADSLEDLCRQTGINLEGLKKTIEQYNRAYDTGRDELFYKKAKYLMPLKEPKYYAFKRTAFGIGVPESIRINHQMEVLTKDFEVIPGLYAAGNDAIRSIHKDCYPLLFSGNNMGWAINSGRIAGESASEYINSSTGGALKSSPGRKRSTR